MPYDHNQTSMVVINFLDQVQPGTFEHTVHHLIEHRLDLSIFDQKYRNDDTGRHAYDPAVLLTVILFAYSKGITSSREIQWCCETNIMFMALACGSVPHFTTIAGFVSDKLRKQIKRCIKEHKASDKRTAEGKEASRRRTAQKMEALNRAADRIDEFLDSNEARQGQGRQKKRAMPIG